jgi:hypothetical protein
VLDHGGDQRTKDRGEAGRGPRGLYLYTRAEEGPGRLEIDQALARGARGS